MTDDAGIDPTTGRKKKYRITKLQLDEVSLVDLPAHPQAVVTIFKRDDPMANNSEDARRAEVEAALAKAGAEGGDAALLAKARDACAALRRARIAAEASLGFVSDDALRKAREGAIRTATAAAVELERRRRAAAGDGGGELSPAELAKRQRAGEEEVVGYERHRLKKRAADQEKLLELIRREQHDAELLLQLAKDGTAKIRAGSHTPGERHGQIGRGGKEAGSMNIPGTLTPAEAEAVAEFRKRQSAESDPQAAALSAIERIAKKHQSAHGGTYDAAVAEVSKTDPMVGQLYALARGKLEIEDAAVLLKSLREIGRD